jgi:hypothetical protein
MSSLALGFLRSRLQPAARSSAAGTFQARSFFLRLSHQSTSGANSSNWTGAVFVGGMVRARSPTLRQHGDGLDLRPHG